ISPNAENKVLPLAEQRRRHLDTLLVRKGLDRASGGDGTQQRDLARSGRLLSRRDASAPIPLPRKRSLLFEALQMFLHGPEGGEPEPFPDFPLGRRDSFLTAIIPYEIENFLLSFGKIHNPSN